MISTIFRRILTTYDKYLFTYTYGCSVTGTLLGVSISIHDSWKYNYNISETIFHVSLNSIIGCVGGATFSLLSPIIIPSTIIVLPSYALRQIKQNTS